MTLPQEFAALVDSELLSHPEGTVGRRLEEERASRFKGELATTLDAYLKREAGESLEAVLPCCGTVGPLLCDHGAITGHLPGCPAYYRAAVAPMVAGLRTELQTANEEAHSAALSEDGFRARLAAAEGRESLWRKAANAWKDAYYETEDGSDVAADAASTAERAALALPAPEPAP